MNHLRSKLQKSTFYKEEGTEYVAFCWQKCHLKKKNLWATALREAYASPTELCPIVMGVAGLARKKEGFWQFHYPYLEF